VKRDRLHRFDRVEAIHRLAMGRSTVHVRLIGAQPTFIEAGTVGTVLSSMGPTVMVAWPGNRTSHVRPSASPEARVSSLKEGSRVVYGYSGGPVRSGTWGRVRNVGSRISDTGYSVVWDDGSMSIVDGIELVPAHHWPKPDPLKPRRLIG
jgi:hypothetical protein